MSTRYTIVLQIQRIDEEGMDLEPASESEKIKYATTELTLIEEVYEYHYRNIESHIREKRQWHRNPTITCVWPEEEADELLYLGQQDTLDEEIPW